MGFSRQEYYSGLPFPSPGDLPNPGIEPRSPEMQAEVLTSEPPWKPKPCNINQRVPVPAVHIVGSAPPQIWSYSSLYLLPKSTAAATAKSLQSTIAPKVHNCHQSPQPQANCGDLTCCTCSYRSEFPSSSLVTQLLMFSIGFGPISVCRPHCIVCSQPRQ